jgi:hypothetical protein
MTRDEITLSTARSLIASGKATREQLVAKFDIIDDEVQAAPSAGQNQSASRPQTRLLDRTGLSSDEVKRRAAAGEPVLQKGEGLRSATASENVRGVAAASVAGAGRGLGGMVGLAADVATAPVRGGIAAGKALASGEGIGGAFRANVKEQASLPATTVAMNAADDAKKTFTQRLGVDAEVAITEWAEAADLTADILVPIPPASVLARGVTKGAFSADDVIRFYERKIAQATDDATREALGQEMRRTAGSVAPKAPAAPVDVAAPPTARAGATTARHVIADAKAPDAPKPPATPEAPKPPKEVSTFTKFREAVEDDWIRVKKLVRDPDVSVTDATDPYLAETLFHGRLAARLEEGRTIAKGIDNDLVQTAKKLKADDAALTRDVNRYLHARHAPERNAAIGADAAGMSDAEAAKVLREIGSSPNGKEIKRIADQWQDLHNRTLDVLLEGEVITPELYATLKSKYKSHVPLNRIMDDAEDIGVALTSRPLDVKSTGIYRAVGSDREVADIGTNIVTAYEQALIRAEKNRVDLTTLRFARDNPNLGLFSEIKPKAKGKTFDGEGIIFEEIKDPQVLTLREGGKPVHLRIHDKHLATALRGINREKVGGLLRIAGAFSRFYSGLATRFNPEFAFPNKIRDLQEATIYAFSKGEMGAKGAAKIVGRDVASVRTLVDSMRGLDTPGTRLYQQMVKDGGTTGGMGLSTRKQVELDLEAIRKLNRSSPHRAASMIFEHIDHWNRIFEDSTRLSVYQSALEQGMTRPRAAQLAKNASINFNKFGKLGPQANALYMFANASIQGSAKMLRAMKSPRVAATVTASMAVAVASVSEWNDRVNPKWRDHVSPYDRLSSLPVMIPGADRTRYFTVPVSWGLKPIKVAMDYAYDAASGHSSSAGEVAEGIATAVLEGYNPAGGTDVASAVTPTIFDLPVDLSRNVAWHGGKVRPDWHKNRLPSEQYWDKTPESLTGELSIAAAEGLSSAGIEVSPENIKYAYETAVGGAGRTGSKILNTFAAAGKGEMPEPREIPFASRFYRSLDDETARRREVEAEDRRRKAAARRERKKERAGEGGDD